MPEQTTAVEKTVSIAKEAIIDEAKRIEENCLFTAKGHFVVAQFWTNFHLWIGIPSVVLAGAAGTAAFAKFDSNNIVAGVTAIIVAILTGLSTFLNPSDRSKIHLNAGNNYDSLLSRIRIFWTIECRKENSDEILAKKLKDFSDERDKLNRECPQVPKWAYKIAKKGIEAGEADYIVDKNKKII